MFFCLVFCVQSFFLTLLEAEEGETESERKQKTHHTIADIIKLKLKLTYFKSSFFFNFYCDLVLWEGQKRIWDQHGRFFYTGCIINLVDSTLLRLNYKNINEKIESFYS